MAKNEHLWQTFIGEVRQELKRRNLARGYGASEETINMMGTKDLVEGIDFEIIKTEIHGKDTINH